MKPLRERRPVSPADRQRMVVMYRDDKLSVREVAAATDRSYATVWNVLDREGVQLRETSRVPRGPATHPRAPQVNTTRAERKGMAEMYQAGHPLSAVAKRYGRGAGTVHRILKQMGVERRPPGRTHRLATRHWCGEAVRHAPHKGCNGFGLLAGPPDGLCSRLDAHAAHISCDGYGAAA